MENNSDSSIFNFNIDEESKSNFSAIAQWANINAIVGFASAGITLLSFVITMVRFSGFSGSSSVLGTGLFSLVIGIVISLVMNVTLIYAAINLKKGLLVSDQQTFVTGLTKLATYFKIFGILMIVVIVIVVLALIFGLLMGGLTRGF